MPWYHMMIPQIVGSMGLVGIAGYGFQIFGRLRLIFAVPIRGGSASGFPISAFWA